MISMRVPFFCFYNFCASNKTTWNLKKPSGAQQTSQKRPSGTPKMSPDPYNNPSFYVTFRTLFALQVLGQTYPKKNRAQNKFLTIWELPKPHHTPQTTKKHLKKHQNAPKPVFQNETNHQKSLKKSAKKIQPFFQYKTFIFQKCKHFHNKNTIFHSQRGTL